MARSDDDKAAERERKQQQRQQRKDAERQRKIEAQQRRDALRQKREDERHQREVARAQKDAERERKAAEKERRTLEQERKAQERQERADRQRVKTEQRKQQRAAEKQQEQQRKKDKAAQREHDREQRLEKKAQRAAANNIAAEEKLRNNEDAFAAAAQRKAELTKRYNEKTERRSAVMKGDAQSQVTGGGKVATRNTPTGPTGGDESADSIDETVVSATPAAGGSTSRKVTTTTAKTNRRARTVTDDDDDLDTAGHDDADDGTENTFWENVQELNWKLIGSLIALGVVVLLLFGTLMFFWGKGSATPEDPGPTNVDAVDGSYSMLDDIESMKDSQLNVLRKQLADVSEGDSRVTAEELHAIKQMNTDVTNALDPMFDKVARIDRTANSAELSAVQNQIAPYFTDSASTSVLYNFLSGGSPARDIDQQTRKFGTTLMFWAGTENKGERRTYLAVVPVATERGLYKGVYTVTVDKSNRVDDIAYNGVLSDGKNTPVERALNKQSGPASENGDNPAPSEGAQPAPEEEDQPRNEGSGGNDSARPSEGAISEGGPAASHPQADAPVNEDGTRQMSDVIPGGMPMPFAPDAKFYDPGAGL